MRVSRKAGSLIKRCREAFLAVDHHRKTAFSEDEAFWEGQSAVREFQRLRQQPEFLVNPRRNDWRSKQAIGLIAREIECYFLNHKKVVSTKRQYASALTALTQARQTLLTAERECDMRELRSTLKLFTRQLAIQIRNTNTKAKNYWLRPLGVWG